MHRLHAGLLGPAIGTKVWPRIMRFTKARTRNKGNVGMAANTAKVARYGRAGRSGALSTRGDEVQCAGIAEDMGYHLDRRLGRMALPG